MRPAAAATSRFNAKQNSLIQQRMSLGNLVLRLESLDDKAKTTPDTMSFIQRNERADGGALNQTVLKHCKEPCEPSTFFTSHSTH